jgi:hydroxypyruvate isomerase
LADSCSGKSRAGRQPDAPESHDGNPGRHEPDVGEIHYPAVFEAIDAIGYKGFIGCEYTPKTRTEDGLGWFAPYRPR